VRFILVIVLIAACQPNVKAEHSQAAASSDAGIEAKKVVVKTASGGIHPVRVEVAATPEEKERGLMHRRELGAEDGMLFIFEGESERTFWMRNTLIPLDMIFIRADGTIAGIVADAQPLTETPRTIKKPSKYVLEVNGGWAARKGVTEGDTVIVASAVR
jgi:uncharacterized membrane protein (UPF0127 family)